MENATPTGFIVDALTRSIVEHRLLPGSKLVEQKLADQFGVSRTLIRQALFRLSQNRLIRMEPARGAFVSAPSLEEARQVFSVRRMLEAGMVRTLIADLKPQHIKALKDHIKLEGAAIGEGDISNRTELLGDFHVLMAKLIGNTVLAQMLGDLNSRCALITMIYQSEQEAAHSQEEHIAIVNAIQARDEPLALQLLDEHLCHVQAALIPESSSPTTTRSL